MTFSAVYRSDFPPSSDLINFCNNNYKIEFDNKIEFELTGEEEVFFQFAQNLWVMIKLTLK